MSDITISVRIDKSLYEKMKLHEHLNWSALLRRYLLQQVEKLEEIDTEKAKQAADIMDKIRKLNAFDRGKSGTEIIRGWRNKRK
ncbi:MAG: hypothetical protein AABW51_01040 [Nanoarchaeota archaeon]